MFFLVSGAAASGKSTVVRGVATRMPDVECHDYDELPVRDEYARCEQLEGWVRQALRDQAGGRDFLLATHSPLGELLACPSAPELAGIAACLLDCSDPIRIARLRARGIDPRWPPSQATLNWAAWHRMHAWDPQWETAGDSGEWAGIARVRSLARLAAGRPALARGGAGQHTFDRRAGRRLGGRMDQ